MKRAFCAIVLLAGCGGTPAPAQDTSTTPSSSPSAGPAALNRGQEPRYPVRFTYEVGTVETPVHVTVDVENRVNGRTQTGSTEYVAKRIRTIESTSDTVTKGTAQFLVDGPRFPGHDNPLADPTPFQFTPLDAGSALGLGGVVPEVDIGVGAKWQTQIQWAVGGQQTVVPATVTYTVTDIDEESLTLSFAGGWSGALAGPEGINGNTRGSLEGWFQLQMQGALHTDGVVKTTIELQLDENKYLELHDEMTRVEAFGAEATRRIAAMSPADTGPCLQQTSAIAAWKDGHPGRDKYITPMSVAVRDLAATKRPVLPRPPEAVFVFHGRRDELVAAIGEGFEERTQLLDQNRLAASARRALRVADRVMNKAVPVVLILKPTTPLDTVKTLVAQVPRRRTVGIAAPLSREARVESHVKNVAPDTPPWVAEALRSTPPQDPKHGFGGFVDIVPLYQSAVAGCYPAREVPQLLRGGGGIDVLAPGIAEAFANCECKGVDIPGAWSLLLFGIYPGEEAGYAPLSKEDQAALEASNAATLADFMATLD